MCSIMSAFISVIYDNKKTMWRMVLGTTAVAVPVTITVLDLFGYVAKVEGASMQVIVPVWRYPYTMIQ